MRMISNQELEDIKKIVASNKVFVITTHHNPDGDALGSEIAIAEYLRQLGKQVHIINNSAIPLNYRFLDENGEIDIFDEKKHAELLAAVDVFFILDISDWGRLMSMNEIVKKSTATKVCIDHHQIDYQFADIDVIYEAASSTGELIFEFLKRVNFQLNQKIAIALYTCILTDTGSFRFSNTTSQTHAVASELMKYDIDIKKIHTLVYEQNSKAKLALMGEALMNLHYDCNGQLAWFALNK
ncbi:MAG TPA: hypothetical protein ENN22_11430, partial [bacterium]|nr:hypothetical protein [bacterium]